MYRTRFINLSIIWLVWFFPQAFTQSIIPQINGDAVFLTEEVFIAGGCFDVENAQVSGGVGAVGTFSNGGQAIGVESGIILSTGSVLNAYGPNTQTNFTTNFNLYNSDPDLEIMIDNPAIPIQDVTILEFDFTPTSDQVSFEYVFASEEYCDFVNTLYNDVFGFFISGPGINGPFSNSAENIALIPGSADFVAINNVNHLTNSTYYIDNIPVNDSQIDGCPGPYPDNSPFAEDIVEFDGFTSVFTASTNVIPCETYHIKLVVGDVTDGQYDSAVFLNANSFEAGETVTVDAIVPLTGTNLTYEGCTDAYFLFQRFNSDLGSALTVDFTISPASSSSSGQDYEPLPATVTFAPGQSSVQLPVSFYADEITEGQETLILEMESACSCYSTTATFIVDDGSLLIAELEPVSLCEGETAVIEPQISGGQPPYDFLWSDGTSNPFLANIPQNSDSIFLMVFDACGRSVSLESYVEITPKPTVFFEGEAILCNEESEVAFQVFLEGESPWMLTYSIDDVLQSPVTILASPFLLQISQPGVYVPEFLESSTCLGEVEGFSVVNTSELEVVVHSENVSCFGMQDGVIHLDILGSNPPFSILWNDGVQAEFKSNLSPGMYSVSVTDEEGCSFQQEILIQEPNILNANFVLEHLSCHGSADGQVFIQASGGTPPYLFQLTDSDFQNDPLFENLTAGDYLVTVLDANGCTFTDQVVIEEPGALEVSVDQVSPACLGMQSGSISVFLSGGSGGDYVFSLDGGEFQTAPLFDQLEAGMYELEVKDENGCQWIQNVDIQAPPPFEVELIVLQPTCSVYPDGAIQVLTEETYGQPVFSINGGEFQGDPGFEALHPGNYQVVVLDESGCEVIISSSLDNPASVVPEISGPVAVCEGDSVVLSVTGNFEQFFWSTGESGNSIVALEAGHFEVTAVDDEGCWGVAGYDVGSIPIPEVQMLGDSVLCVNETSVLTLNGSFLSQIWSDGMTGDSMYVDLPGIYSANIEFAPGCWMERSMEIKPNEIPPVIISGSLTFCEDGSTQLFTNDNYNSFLWSDGSTNPQLEVSDAGIYHLTVIDSNGCSSSDTVLVEISDFIMPEILGAPGLCVGDSLELSLQGSYDHYLWSTGATESSIWIKQPGIYSVTIQNGSSCFGEDSISIAAYPEVDVEITGNTAFCYPEVSTLATTVNYENYLWSDGTNGANLNINQSGSYAVTVTDENGCEGNDFVIVDQLLPAMTHVQMDLCAGDTMAFANQLVFSSGYYIDTLVNGAVNGCDSIIFLQVELIETVSDSLLVMIPEGEEYYFGGHLLNQSGEYLDTLTSENTFCDSIVRLLLEVIEIPIIYDTLHFITCENESVEFNGMNYAESGIYQDTIFGSSIWESDSVFMIQVENIPNDTTLLKYQLCSGDSIFINGQWISEDAIIRDTLLNEYGCDSMVITTVVFADLNLNIELIQPVFCHGDSTAIIEAVVSSSELEYDLFWSTGDQNSTIEGLPAGDYQVLASNDIGCMAADSIRIEQPKPIKAIWETQLDCKNPGQAFLNVLSVTGGTPPYLYSLANNQFQSEPKFLVESPSSQNLLIEDAFGCIEQYEKIEIDRELDVDIILEDPRIMAGDTILLETYANFDPVAVHWEGSPFLSCWDCYEPLAFPEETTAFTVSMLTKDSCWVDAQLTVFVDQRIDVYIPTAFSPNGDGINDYFTIFAGSQVGKIRLLDIFDRWGNLVFSQKDFIPNDEFSGWDGLFNGKPMGVGVYVYYAKVETLNGETLDYNGEIVLIRN